MGSPILNFYTGAGVTVSALSFGTVNAGTQTAEFGVWLWNNFNGVVSSDTAVNVLISVLDSLNGKSSQFIREGWVLARSSGTSNPNLTPNFFDDAQTTAIPLSDVENLPIGDIPSNCGRQILVSVSVPAGSPTQAGLTVQLLGSFGLNSTPLPYFFNRAFGDGVVQEVFKQIYPAVLSVKAGTWTNLSAIIGGAYTGTANKGYFVKVVTGGSPGVALYQCSDNNEVSYSSSLISGTNSFSNLVTSANVFEGVQAAWVTTDQPLAVGDKWLVNVETRPFQFKAGLSTSLTGYVGAGNALIANNRVYFMRPSSFTLAASTTTFIFLGANGSFIQTTGPTPANTFQAGALLLGRFLTDANGVTDQSALFPYVTLGLDAFDDFSPIWTQISGLTWSYFQGRFKRFNSTVYLPDIDTLTASLALAAGVSNYVEIDPLNSVVKLGASGFDVDAIPLWEIGTDTNYITSVIDRRARVGLAIPSIKQTVSFLTGVVNVNQTLGFDQTLFGNRALVRSFVVTAGTSATSSGFTLSFFGHDTKLPNDVEYQAGTLTSPFTDPFVWDHEDLDNTLELHGSLQNNTGVTQNFQVDMIYERFA